MVDLIEPLCGRGLLALGGVGREERGDGGFGDERAGLVAPRGIVGERAHDVGIEIDGEPVFFHEASEHIIAGVERGLAGCADHGSVGRAQTGDVGIDDVVGIGIEFVIEQLRFRDGLFRVEFRLLAQTGAGGII